MITLTTLTSTTSTSRAVEALQKLDPHSTSADWANLHCWCDCDIEVNPANGKWALEIREAIPNECIFQWGKFYFSFNDYQIAYYKSESTLSK